MDHYIEINSNYFFNNMRIIKNITNCIIAPVLKSNAYGHGIDEIVALLKNDGNIEYICVAYTNEAVKVKQSGWNNKIIIMSSSQDMIEIDDNFQYFLYSFDFLFILLEKAILNNIMFQVHIKLNCGMNRLGFNHIEIDKLIQLLMQNQKYIKIVGICTHFPRLDYRLTEEIAKQVSLFNSLVDIFKKIFGDKLLIHPFSSKGINLIEKSSAYCNMIRVGGALYGLLNDKQKKILLEESINNNLNQIMTLKARVIAIREVKKNEYIGYGENYKTKKDEIIAIVQFGYGCGYSISLLDAPIVGYCNDEYLFFAGLIGMNALFFNISSIKNKIKCGDYIILTTNDVVEIRAANLSNWYIGGREYTFTTMLHESIRKLII